jgi:hypothetical protein
MMRIIVFCTALFIAFSVRSEQVLVNKPQSDTDSRYDYPHQLLQRILEETETDYPQAKVTHTDYVMSRNRMLLSLVEGTLLHVVAEAPKKAWLEKLLVIRIPIRKGIQGYRLFFINESDQRTIARIKTLKEFMKLATGSGAGWSTAQIMSSAGFNVVTGNNYDGLFDMLEKRRFLTLGRGINEIGPEFLIQKKLHPNLAIESTLAVHIPLPTYFFVSPEKPKLAKRIEEGLWKLIDSGDFDKIFLSFHKKIIEGTNLQQRRIFSLPNPNLTADDPLHNENLWYTF